MEELHFITTSMAKGKSSNLDKVMVKFYIYLKNLISENYFKMIVTTIKEGFFFNGVNKGLITLLFKVGGKNVFVIKT